jgi:hypothetical protein
MMEFMQEIITDAFPSPCGMNTETVYEVNIMGDIMITDASDKSCCAIVNSKYCICGVL